MQSVGKGEDSLISFQCVIHILYLVFLGFIGLGFLGFIGIGFIYLEVWRFMIVGFGVSGFRVSGFSSNGFSVWSVGFDTGERLASVPATSCNSAGPW